MNFDLSESQALFKATVERFCGNFDHAERLRTRQMAGGMDRRRWSALAEAGLIGLAASEADGGLGGSEVDCAVVAQAMGHELALEPWLECAYLPARLLAGTPYLASVIDGSALATLAFAEAKGRYTLDARITTASRHGEDYVLSGEKKLVLSGAAADLLIVTALTDGETRPFVVQADAPGVDRRPYPIVDGSVAAIVTFRNVSGAIPVGGPQRLSDAVNQVRLMAAAEMAGLARRLFENTLDYVKTRHQFDQPIGSFQVVQHRLVDALSKCEAIQSAVYRGLLQPGSHAAGVKAFVAEEAQWVAEQAVQLHGGMGMTDELAIGHGLKRIMLLSRLFGDPASGLASYAQAA